MYLILFLAVSGLILAGAYRWYGRLLANYLQLDPKTATPAHTNRDGVDFERLVPSSDPSSRALTSAGCLPGFG
jgi:carbon starvation protein CstA